MNLYFISARDDINDYDFCLLVQAQSRKHALKIWRAYYELSTPTDVPARVFKITLKSKTAGAVGWYNPTEGGVCTLEEPQ